MEISVFDVVGPVMIGPSSSHTAGAARLGRIARTIVDAPFHHVSFGLHGSFAKTYRGHGTDRALVAGVLGFFEDDERLRDSFALAEAENLTYDFYETRLEGVRANAVKMTFSLDNGETMDIIGSSVGGGAILIQNIGGVQTEFSATSSTLIIRQHDKRGVVSNVTSILAEQGINIGVMKLTRTAKGTQAFCVIEVDNPIPDEATAQIRQVENVIQVLALNVHPKEA